MAGMVSERDSASSIRDWQETADLLFAASLFTTTALRKVLTPPSLEMERAFDVGAGIRGAVNHLRAGV